MAVTIDGTANTITAAATTATALSTASGSAPSYSARAWVNFNGTGTVAIRASGNVSSITDNGTGNYTLNFATALPDTDYIFTTGNTVVGANVNGAYYTPGQTKTTTQFRIITYSYVVTGADNSDVYITIFR